tara:strand:+ start:1154 stop:1765 length:612 start_codon:yes stop_codon:yes gene_type:complete
MKIILILCSWSSGSTSVAGFLDRCGCHTCPPHYPTNDPKTPNAYESHALRNHLHQLIDIETSEFKQIGKEQVFESFFKDWIEEQKELASNIGKNFIVLKHPLKIFVMKIIEKYTNPEFLVLTRPFEKIESTRLRRRWPEIYGEKAAVVIYKKIYEYLQQSNHSFLNVSYANFLKDQKEQQRIIDFFGLNPTDRQLEDAKNWLR